MIRAIVLAVVGAAALLGSLAHAESQSERKNWYFQALIGQRYVTEADLTLEGTRSEVTTLNSIDNPSGSGAFGYRIPSFPYDVIDLRIEVEGGATDAEPDTIKPRGLLATRVGTTAETGMDAEDLMAIWGMVNLWFDHYLSDSWLVSAGGGLGVTYIDYNVVRVGETVILDDSDLVFAYQGGVAVGYEIIPNLVLIGDYRYFATTDPQLSSAGDFEAEYKSHNATIGFRIFF